VSWIAFSLGYTGVALFALAMTVHHRTAFGGVPDSRRVLAFRFGGSVLLIASLGAAVKSFGWPIGVVTWSAILVISGFLLTQLLAFAPRLLPWPAIALLGVAGLTGASNEVPATGTMQNASSESREWARISEVKPNRSESHYVHRLGSSHFALL
jgi:hypothetical protein